MGMSWTSWRRNIKCGVGRIPREIANAYERVCADLLDPSCSSRRACSLQQ